MASAKKNYLVKRANLSNLNALRAFEAAARNGSYVAAARELNVTPAAVGQQVRALEDWLEMALFVRSNAGGARLKPTATAVDALGSLREGFDLVSAGLSKLREAKGRSTLTVTASQSFFSKWLLARIEKFQEAYPNIELRLDVSDRLSDFANEGVDLGIRYGSGHWPRLSVELLMQETVFPVCGTDLTAGHKAMNSPNDLLSRVLIHDTTVGATGEGFPTWRDWFRLAGLDTQHAEQGLKINSSAAILQAAMSGQGVALARSVLVADDLALGGLRRPFIGLELPVKHSWYIVHRSEVAVMAKIQAFKSWILAEASQ